MNISRTAKVLRSKLTKTIFSIEKYSLSNKNLGQLFVCSSVVGLVVTSWNSFFCCAQFLNVCFSGLFKSTIFKVIYFDFVFP